MRASEHLITEVYWTTGAHAPEVLIQAVPSALCFVKFAVNFLCANGDIAFHFNPRFDTLKPVVVCNTQMKIFWGEEEIAPSMPFKQNSSFEMTVNLESGCYQVRWDWGGELCTRQQRDGAPSPSLCQLAELHLRSQLA
uniref:Galectin n=1 Tax=Podarcis muralis TaxID=64176 RepID=A0A670ISD1_PODMU